MNIKTGLVGLIGFVLVSFFDCATANIPTTPTPEKKPRNELGFDQNEAYVSDLKSYWTYSSLHYFRLSDYGTLGGRINYANRLGTHAYQYQLETYPKLWKGAYTNFTMGVADADQILYPSFQYRIEPYFTLPHATEISVGKNYSKYAIFDNQKIEFYTGSLNKYIGNYLLWYRPYYFQPTHTYLNEAGLRRYFDDDSLTYLTIRANTGKLPDIGDLPPLDQILVLRQSGVSMDGQYAINKVWLVKGEIGYLHQKYLLSQHLRNITDFTLGLAYRF